MFVGGTIEQGGNQVREEGRGTEVMVLLAEHGHAFAYWFGIERAGPQ
jgi:hypothetical protein